ncbi:MAG: methyltransferase [Actinomycetota bacterium]|nr:methyltransferase [Actinomycetota bacterium]
MPPSAVLFDGQTPAIAERVRADSLGDAGLLVRDGGRFRNAPDAEAFLAGRSPFDLRPLARYWDLVSYPTWQHATEAYRTRRGLRPQLDKTQTEAYESAVALATAETVADLARGYDFGPHRRLLDVGGGYGTFVKPILTAYPELSATLVDLPEVASAVSSEAADGPLAGRLTAVGQNIFAEPLPGGHDAVLVANVVHLFPARADRRAVPPGARGCRPRRAPAAG